MTIRLLSTYRQFKPNTNVTLASGTETALVASGNATTDLSGGVPYDYQLPANTMQGNVAYAPDGVPLGLADSTGKILSGFSGIAAPGAPTGLALTAIAGGVLATLTAPASNGGTGLIGYEITLSTGQVQLGETTTITVNAPAGVAVTATAKAINGFGKSVASTASASATPTAFVTPGKPGAPTIGTLVSGNGKVTVNWTAAAANGSALRNNLVTLSNGATAVAAGNATSIDVTTPNGIAVTATVRANNGEGAGPVSGVSNSATPGLSASVPVIATPTALGVASTYSTPDTVTAQQWSLNGADVGGATAATYTQVIADSSKALRVRVTTAQGPATSRPALLGVQNFKLSNTSNLRAALAGGVRSAFLCAGDSSMAGLYSGGNGNVNIRPNSFMARLVAGLVAAGIPASKDSSFGSDQTTTPATYNAMDPRWTLSSGILLSTESFGGKMIEFPAGGTESAVFVPGNAFDTIDLYSAANAAACAVDVFVDANPIAVATVPLLSTGVAIKQTTITVPSGSTSVTIKFSIGSGSVNPKIPGLVTRNAAVPQIEVINGGRSGLQVKDIAVAPSGITPVPRSVMNQIALAGYTKGVLFINGWYNDQNGAQRTLAQVLADYTTICTENATRGWDLVYVGYPLLAMDATQYALFESSVVSLLRDTFNAVIVQESKIIPYGAPYLGDALHINGAGHQKIADSLTTLCLTAITAGALPA